MPGMTKSANPDLARSCTDLVLLTLLQQEPMYGWSEPLFECPMPKKALT